MPPPPDEERPPPDECPPEECPPPERLPELYELLPERLVPDDENPDEPLRRVSLPAEPLPDGRLRLLVAELVPALPLPVLRLLPDEGR